MWLPETSRTTIYLIAACLFFATCHGTSFGYDRWSLWSSWTDCSRTCGGGIATRTRSCQPGYYSGHQGSRCSGNVVQHMLCNKQRCPAGSLNSAEAQCSQYNGKDIFGHRVKRWLPDDDHKKNPCELRCRSEDSSVSYSFGQMANGTSCMRDGQGVCFRGRCTKVGCDAILGSPMTRDMCGTCGGRNLSCVQVQQVHSSTQGNLYDYVPITVIPAWATNILVQEHTKNFLALLDGPPPNVTSRFSPHIPGELKLGGTIFTYRMGPDHNETFSALGPTTRPVTLMAFLTERGGQDVFYAYWIPKESPTTSRLRSTPPVKTSSEARKALSVRTARSHPDDEPRAVTAALLRDDPTRASLDNRIPVLVKEQGRRRSKKVLTVPSASETNVLPVLHSRKPKKPLKKPKKQRKGPCRKCHRVKNQLEHYCKSDLAAHVRVLSSETMDRGQVRYDVAVLETFRNVFPLQQREFLWSPNATCPCPRLVVGSEYVVMGYLEPNYRRKEARLVANDRSFVRRFNENRLRQLRRLRQRRNDMCNRTL